MLLTGVWGVVVVCQCVINSYKGDSQLGIHRTCFKQLELLALGDDTTQNVVPMPPVCIFRKRFSVSSD